MKYIPKNLTRFASRKALKLQGASPTILVVGGVAGLVGTAVLAAVATRKLDPVLEKHAKLRAEIEGSSVTEKEYNRAIVGLYGRISVDVLRVYAPTLALGTVSTVAVLSGHKILKGRHIATMAAYSGLAEQFAAYRERVAETYGEGAEQELRNGAVGILVDDPENPGEKKRVSLYKSGDNDFLRPFFDEYNTNWTRDATSNYLFLKGVQQHLNHVLQTRGHVFLNEATDALRLPRTPEGAVTGWIYGPDSEGDSLIDFGFMTGDDPQTVAFRNGKELSVRLNFNIDGLIWDKI